MTKYFSILKTKLNRLSAQPPKGKIETYIVKYLGAAKPLVVVDIGAHKGDFINELEKSYQIESGVLIEPIPALAGFLSTKFNNGKFRVFNNAVSDKDFVNIEFQVNEFAETSSLLAFKTGMKELENVDTRPSKKEMVVSRTLDSIVAEAQLKAIDLLKIDVQGVEHLVLAGAKETIATTRYIWVELSFKPLYTGSSVFSDIYNIMEEQGFMLLELSPGHRSPAGELLQADALFANPKFL